MKTSVIGAFEAKTKFSELLSRVAESGAEFIITKHDKPIARLIPAVAKVSPADAAAGIAQWRKQRDRNKLKGLKIKELISEGRA